VFDALRRDADIVLVDSPPALVVADALAMAPYADGVVAVAVARATGRDDAVALRQELDRAGAHLLGFVLTKVRPRRRVSSYYYGGSGNYGGSGHSDERRTERATAVPSPPVPEPEPGLVVEPAVGPVHDEEPRPSSNGTPPPAEWGFGDWVAATVPGDG
jgi:Mrp family chromosome partitioning ATPase